MSTEIIIAIISGSAVIIGAIITVVFAKSKNTNPEHSNNQSTFVKGNNNVVNQKTRR